MRTLTLLSIYQLGKIKIYNRLTLAAVKIGFRRQLRPCYQSLQSIFRGAVEV
jgi:hypothetical protein